MPNKHGEIKKIKIEWDGIKFYANGIESIPSNVADKLAEKAFNAAREAEDNTCSLKYKSFEDYKNKTSI